MTQQSQPEKTTERLEAELEYWQKQFNSCYRYCRRAWAHNAFYTHRKFVACLTKMGEITSSLRLELIKRGAY